MLLYAVNHTGKKLIPRMGGYGKIESTSKNLNDYYAHGLQHNTSWTRDNNSNNFLYNAGSEMNTTTNLYDLPNRNYDAALGRFHQVDPLAHYDHVTSPFAYAGNNPLKYNDPTGLTFKLEGDNALVGAVDTRNYTSDWSESITFEVTYASNRASDASKVLDGRMAIEDYISKYGGKSVSIKPLPENSEAKEATDDSNGGKNAEDESGAGETQGDAVDDLHEFADFFFNAYRNKIEKRLNGNHLFLDIDYAGKYTGEEKGIGKTLGATFRNENGDIEVWINPSVLNSILTEGAGKLYLVLQHELVHAMDWATGKIDELRKEFRGAWEFKAELRAHYNSLLVEQNLGVKGGSQIMINMYTQQLIEYNRLQFNLGR